MKKFSFTVLVFAFAYFYVFAQQEDTKESFYYYGKEKIPLMESRDKIFLKFVPDANKEKIEKLLSDNNMLTPIIDTGSLSYAVLESKNEEFIPAILFENFKANSEIVSANSILEYNGVLQGQTDEFVVKLKKSTSLEKLQDIVLKNSCKIIKESQFVESQYLISVSKISKFNAIQTANLFYETGLFEFSEPNFVIINAFHSNDTYFNEQWGLKNTGQNGGMAGVDIKAESAWAITQGTPNIKIAVVDQGVDLTHPDLSSNLLRDFFVICYNLFICHR
jgi:hypothetical protein